jgi:hypothetical protein
MEPGQAAHLRLSPSTVLFAFKMIFHVVRSPGAFAFFTSCVPDFACAPSDPAGSSEKIATDFFLIAARAWLSKS